MSHNIHFVSIACFGLNISHPQGESCIVEAVQVVTGIDNGH